MRSKQMGMLLLAALVFVGPGQIQAETKTTRRVASVDHGGALMNLGAGFLIASATAPGVGVGFSTRITSRAPVYLGVDTGSYFLTGPFAWLIPIMPMVKYLFHVNAPVIPTLGLSIGPVIGIGSGASAVQFSMLFKPGIQFNMNKDLDIFFEPRFGVYGSAFVFDPEISALFSL